MVLNVHRNHKTYYGWGEGGMEVGEEGDYYTYHHQNGSCIMMGSDESHFNVSEEKGEPKQYRTKVLSLTSLTPYR